MTRASRFGLMTLLLCTAAPVLAGADPLYEAPPAWVEPAELTADEIAAGPTVALFDTQKRIEGAKVWEYRDVAIKIDSPDTLTSAGTLSASWIPDKGDLIVNRVEILRGAAVVDVIGQGTRFTVLRREEQLEQRSIDGMLTATLVVPGLRVGDTLRLAYTTVQADQALGDKVQSFDGLPRKPVEFGEVRVKVSWPEGQPIQYQAGPGVEVPAPTVKGGFKTLEIPLPLPEREPVPADAPGRYGREALLQVGSFASWMEVSRTLAPHFETRGTIAPKGEIAGRIAGIMKASKDPLTRAAMALRIVQDEISYLANGLDGGNYIPQKPEETWQLRYGDCKAKTVLLLAMLREMGIDAEAVAVHSQLGDSVPLLLPMPGAFDHVIVRAEIGGVDYWLDGTTSGTRLGNIAEVPPFRYGLPIDAAGSGLAELVQRPVTQPDRAVTLTLDQSAGIDLPALFTTTIEYYGTLGAAIRPWAAEGNEKNREDFAGRIVRGVVGDANLLDYTIAYDDEAAKGTVTAHGMLASAWQFERGTARENLPALPATDFSFTADRARQAWRDIPVQMPGPYIFKTDLKVILPEGGKGYELRGREVVNTEIAGTAITRDAVLAGDTLTVSEQLASNMVEIAPAAIAAEKAKAARFGAGKLSVVAPAGAKRRWDTPSAADRAKFARIEDGYDAIIAKAPDETGGYMARSAFRASILDWRGALADVDAALAIEPTVTAHQVRAYYLTELGRKEEALADIRAAFDLEPSAGMAMLEASALAELDRFDEAIELAESYEEDSESYVAALITKAQILGMAGRADEGLALFEKLLAERPGDPELLNGLCWQMGAWNLAKDSVLQQCTKAVESADWSPPVLDSRAMAYFRLGRLQEALADYDAALSGAPGLAPTLYMRGIVRQKIGDKDGAKDIEQALKLQPSLKATYARYGIEAPAG